MKASEANSITITKEGELMMAGKKPTRDAIIAFEELLSIQEDAIIGDSDTCPLEHSFADGIYCRQITIPAGLFVVGKIHKDDHPIFLLSGEIILVTEDGQRRLKGPCSIISSPGAKRAAYAVTEVVWTTVHPNPTNTQDLGKLEDIIIAKSYDEYDKFVEGKGSVVKKLKKRIIKMLSK